jgi:hypothetical protein
MAAGKSAQQYQAMAQGSLINPPSAAEAGDNLINIGNSLFPNEAPVNLMTQGGLKELLSVSASIGIYSTITW